MRPRPFSGEPPPARRSDRFGHRPLPACRHPRVALPRSGGHHGSRFEATSLLSPVAPVSAVRPVVKFIRAANGEGASDLCVASEGTAEITVTLHASWAHLNLTLKARIMNSAAAANTASQNACSEVIRVMWKSSAVTLYLSVEAVNSTNIVQ